MSVEVLKKAMKEKQIPNVVLLYGPEEYQKAFYRQQIILSVLRDGEDDFSHIVLGEREFSVNAFEDAVENVGFTMNCKLIEVPNLDFTKVRDSQRKQFLKMLENIPPYSKVLFSFDAMFLQKDDYKKYKPLFDAVEQNGILAEITEPNRAALAQWLKKQFAFYKKEISTEDAYFLMDYCEGTMAYLKQESEKIAAYIEGNSVTRADILKVTTKSQKAHIFDVSNSIIEGNYDKALSLIFELQSKKEDPISLMSALSSTFMELYFTKACLKDGIVNSEEIGNAMEMAPNRRFLIKRYLPMAQRADIRFLRRCVEACYEADLDLKGSKIDKWQRIEMLIGKMLLAAEKSAKRIG